MAYLGTLFWFIAVKVPFVKGQLPTPVPPARPTTRSGEVTPLKDETKRQYLLTRAEGLRTIILLFVVISFGITVALAIEIVIGETQVKETFYVFVFLLF